jgi:hypothetical protein
VVMTSPYEWLVMQSFCLKIVPTTRLTSELSTELYNQTRLTQKDSGDVQSALESSGAFGNGHLLISENDTTLLPHKQRTSGKIRFAKIEFPKNGVRARTYVPSIFVSNRFDSIWAYLNTYVS